MCRVLIVDDSTTLRCAMRSCIERHPGMEVCGEAENGQVAISKFRQLKPDFVILDFSMPIMDGLEAARRISGIAPGVPLLMFTLFKSEELVEEAHKAGVDSILSKTESNDLVATMESLIQSRSISN